jgi:hypothetical protein
MFLIAITQINVNGLCLAHLQCLGIIYGAKWCKMVQNGKAQNGTTQNGKREDIREACYWIAAWKGSGFGGRICVGNGKRAAIREACHWITRVLASREEAWEPMAFSGVNLCRKTRTVPTVATR